MHTGGQRGSVLIIALFMLMLFTIMGVIATRMSITELKASSNEKVHRLAFYLAEAARAYVAQSPELWGPNNLSSSSPKNFSSHAAGVVLGETQSFDGEVRFLEKSVPPRGSGFETSTFKAYKYKMTCNGYYGHDPNKAKASIEAGFYRVGY